MKVCHLHGLYTPTRHGCPDCAHDENVRRAAKRTKFGYREPHWQALRKARLALAGGICELRIKCDPAAPAQATHIHLAAELDGDYRAATLEDCRACCISCSGADDRTDR